MAWFQTVQKRLLFPPLAANCLMAMAKVRFSQIAVLSEGSREGF